MDMIWICYCTAQDCTVQYCTVLYSTVQCCAVLYSTVQYCTVLYSTARYCTEPLSTVQNCTVLYCAVVYSTIQYCTVLYITVQYCTVMANARIAFPDFFSRTGALWHCYALRPCVKQKSDVLRHGKLWTSPAPTERFLRPMEMLISPANAEFNFLPDVHGFKLF